MGHPQVRRTRLLFCITHYAHCLYCRDTCRPADNLEDLHDEDQPLAGYKSASALGNAIKHWLEYHDYGFRLVNCATVLLHNNIPTDFTNCSRAFKFSIDVGIKREGTRGNPAKAFQLNDVSLVEREELGPTTGHGTRSQPCATRKQSSDVNRVLRSSQLRSSPLFSSSWALESQSGNSFPSSYRRADPETRTRSTSPRAPFSQIPAGYVSRP